MAEDMGDKTETATPRRRIEQREEGNLAKSADLTSTATLVVVIIALWVLSGDVLRNWQTVMIKMIGTGSSSSPVRPEGMLDDFAVSFWAGFRILMPFLIAVFVIGVLTQIMQIGFLITTKPLQPKLSHMDPIKGFKRFGSLRTFAKFASSMAKITFLIVVALVFISSQIPSILLLPRLGMAEAFVTAAELVVQACIWLLGSLLLLALIDWAYQKWQWERENKMTKQQVKEEMKNTMGDPQIKKRQREFAMQILKQRLNQSVPTADVIVTNPEHLAIALQWDPETMNAPKVVAKGADFLALRIRQIATANGIPIVERKPLARALYPLVEVGHEIPPDFYSAIAEILAYVYRITGKKVG